MKRLLIIAVILLTAFAACKKSKPADETGTPDTGNNIPTTGSTLDKVKDSVFLYAKEDYYWYDALPDYATFNPRAITGTDDLTALQNEVDKLSQYKLNPSNNNLPYEYYAPNPGEAKYSFIDEGEASQRLSAVSGDFGFAPLFYLTSTSSTLYVKYVYPGSPADLAGIKRGYIITSINGRTNLSYSTSTADFVFNAYAKSSAITMTLRRPDASTFNVTLNATDYNINPVITYKTFPENNNKVVGYIVFNSFVQLSSAQTALDAAFNSFVNDGVTDLVVDLRYNGGGYVETSEYLANLIAPASVNSKLMYSTYYNSTLTAGKETLLKNQVRRDPKNGQLFNYGQIDYSVDHNKTYFSKKGALNINRVFFIVTGSTASASELTINNLRPYMNVQLIGSTTYGKPVGFFDIDINKYEMYIPEFETKNSSNQGGYYTGMVPGTTDYPGVIANDDPKKEFGDPSESLLALAINYVNKGTYTNSSALAIQSAEGVLAPDRQRAVNAHLTPHQFNGMIRSKYVLKK